MVGSEGTLGFISRVEFETVPLPARTTLAWVHFPDIASAVDPVPELVAAGAGVLVASPPELPHALAEVPRVEDPRRDGVDGRAT